MEVRRRKSNVIWYSLGTLAICILIFLIVWAVAISPKGQQPVSQQPPPTGAGPSRPEKQPEPTRPPQDIQQPQPQEQAERPQPQPLPQAQPTRPTQPAQPPSNGSMMHNDHPAYVYIERPTQPGQPPRNVISVPVGSSPPQGDFQRVDLPAAFEWDGRRYDLESGAPIQLDQDEVVSTGQQVDGRTIYYERDIGTGQSGDIIYLRIPGSSNAYAQYIPD